MKYNLFVTWLLVLTLTGCWDYAKELGHGYRFVRTNADNHGIAYYETKYINHIVVYSDVKDHAYNNDFIVGYKVQSKDAALFDAELQQKSGYFIINKKTSKVESGLPRQAFEILTKKYGVVKLAAQIAE